jgi:hypothetical protein
LLFDAQAGITQMALGAGRNVRLFSEVAAGLSFNRQVIGRGYRNN